MMVTDRMTGCTLLLQLAAIIRVCMIVRADVMLDCQGLGVR